MTRVIQAFADQHTWKQASLADFLKVESRTVRKILEELQASSMPLEREEDHPHVYWSVPQGWFPGGVVFGEEDLDVLVHAVLRVADKDKRRRLMARLAAGRPMGGLSGEGPAEGLRRLERAVTATPLKASEHEHVLLVEQSIREQRALSIHYYSANRGLTWRVISPQRLFSRYRDRLVAYCHLAQRLRWFRLDNIADARLDEEQARVEAVQADIDAFVAASVDGFHDGTDEVQRFTVRSGAARWVRHNLLPGMQPSDAPGGGLCVESRGGALVVARFIAGLGGEATAEGEKLRGLVRDMAERAAAAHGDGSG